MDATELRCYHCEELFTEEEAHRVTDHVTSEFFGVIQTTETTILACPNCGSTSVEEVTPMP